jgi:hypothetical protein
MIATKKNALLIKRFLFLLLKYYSVVELRPFSWCYCFFYYNYYFFSPSTTIFFSTTCEINFNFCLLNLSQKFSSSKLKHTWLGTAAQAEKFVQEISFCKANAQMTDGAHC